MIRSTKTSLRFSNIGKKHELRVFLTEYRRVLQFFVNLLWEEKQIKPLLPKSVTDKAKTWLTARMVQCAGKQASGIVRGTRKKHEQRLWRLKRLEESNGDITNLKKVIDKTTPTKPNLTNSPAELDSRFIKVDLENPTSFDGWLTVTCIGKHLKLVLPFKKHKHFNSLLRKGNLKQGVRIREKDVTFMVEFDITRKTEGDILGVDIGITNALADSNGVLSKADRHNHTLTSILHKISRRKKGSNGFRQACSHRKNYINWSVNQLNLNGVREVKREQIKNLRRGKRTSEFLSHWTYAEMFGKLDRYCDEQGVLVTTVNPAYTSQMCPKCGTLGKRRGKLFVCSCGNKDDSDLNAALNLAGEHIVPRENVYHSSL